MTRPQQSFVAHSASSAVDVPRPPARAGAAMIRAYQRVLRPLTPASCRFAPSCSEYARQALLAHGLLRGGWLALRRIGRCHPWQHGGYDPVPGREG